MTIVKATCTDCGVVNLYPQDLEIHLSVDVSIQPYYSFTCPECQQEVAKLASPQLVRVLESAGAAMINDPPLAKCGKCGEVSRAKPTQLYLLQSFHESFEICYLCGVCGELDREPLAARVAKLLIERGMPLRVAEKLGTDDLLDLHLLLETDDWFDGLVKLVNG